MTERVQCVECERMILPQTAADNDGLCGVCVNIPAELRDERRAFERQLTGGGIFIPSPDVLAAAQAPAELLTGVWELQPEYYEDSDFNQPKDAIEAARTQSKGHIFLSISDKVQLNLGFNEKYAVCEYRNIDTSDFRFAYGNENLSQQVDPVLHMEQCCSSDGVGLLWYPSMFHMLRQNGFKIIHNAVVNQPTADVKWLEVGDISYTGRGRG